jgi:hypothetical protein
MFARVIEELDGESPYWKACLNYDGTTEHAVNCLKSFAKQNPRGEIAGYNCQSINMGYQFILKTVSDKQYQLPENYKDFDCDKAKQVYVSLTGNTKGTECSGYLASNVVEHIKNVLHQTTPCWDLFEVN